MTDTVHPNSTARGSVCDSEEVALKSFFLGPQSENSVWLRSQVSMLFEAWFDWRRSLFPEDGSAISKDDQQNPKFIERKQKVEKLLREVSVRFESEMPKFSPRYIGHMLSEVSLPALLGHVITLLHNPNNISGEASRVGVKFEDEAIRFLSEMIGFPETTSTGHFTSGGTIANFEALLRARYRMYRWLATASAAREQRIFKKSIFESSHIGWTKFDELSKAVPANDVLAWNSIGSNPFDVAKRMNDLYGHEFRGPVALVPRNSHYSWQKGISLLGLGDEALWPIDLDHYGHLSLESLKQQIAKARKEERPILLVTSVVGTTELGAIDPVHKVQDYLDELATKEGIHIWHHVDAAYGGFFCSMLNQSADHPESSLSIESECALLSVSRSNSVTLDPHKLGYVPYASGAFLTRSQREYVMPPFDSPYLEMDYSKDRGPQTLEGSRSAAGAVATWLTAKSIGLDPQGYGRILARTIGNRKLLEETLQASTPLIRVVPGADTNVLCFSVAKQGEPISKSNERTLAVYSTFSPKTDAGFYVSKTALKWTHQRSFLDHLVSDWNANIDADQLILVRLCLMNPFFNSKETKFRYAQEFAARVKALVESTG